MRLARRVLDRRLEGPLQSVGRAWAMSGEHGFGEGSAGRCGKSPARLGEWQSPGEKSPRLYSCAVPSRQLVNALHDGKPLDYEALERWTRIGYERGTRFRKASGEPRQNACAGERRESREAFSPRVKSALHSFFHNLRLG